MRAVGQVLCELLAVKIVCRCTVRRSKPIHAVLPARLAVLFLVKGCVLVRL